MKDLVFFSYFFGNCVVFFLILTYLKLCYRLVALIFYDIFSQLLWPECFYSGLILFMVLFLLSIMIIFFLIGLKLKIYIKVASIMSNSKIFYIKDCKILLSRVQGRNFSITLLWGLFKDSLILCAPAYWVIRLLVSEKKRCHIKDLRDFRSFFSLARLVFFSEESRDSIWHRIPCEYSSECECPLHLTSKNRFVSSLYIHTYICRTSLVDDNSRQQLISTDKPYLV